MPWMGIIKHKAMNVGLGSHLLCLIVKLSLLIGILGQVWCLNVSIPDLCPLAYLQIGNRLWMNHVDE